MTDSKQKYLVIDLQKCDQCLSNNNGCDVCCGYYDRYGEHENGLSGLCERATFALVCRRCNTASCINACEFGALERGPKGIIQRHNMRCVSCKMCAHACPFGTIYTDMLSFYQVSCDPCLNQLETEPSCVPSCPNGALEFRVMDPSETDVHIIDQNLAARATRWVRREVTA